MIRRNVLGLLAITMVLAVPVHARAQEATLTGTVTDSTGAVLPGVTVTASNAATGFRFVSEPPAFPSS